MSPNPTPADCDCPESCKEIKYDYNLNIAYFPSHTMADLYAHQRNISATGAESFLKELR